MTRSIRSCVRIFALLSCCAAANAAVPGDLDGSFGSGGLVLADFAASAGPATDVAVQSNGYAVVVTSGGLTVMRFDADGDVDNGFGTDGKTTFPGTGALDAVALQYDGKIVVAGYWKSSSTSTNQEFFIGRLTTTGMPDNSFGTNGVVTLSAHNGDYLRGIAILADGNIVASGYSNTNTNETGANAWPVTVRVSAAGVPKSDYGTLGNGVASLALTSFDNSADWMAGAVRWRDIAVNSQGVVFVAGGIARKYDPLLSLATTNKWSPIVARLTATGALDVTATNSGWQRLEAVTSESHMNSSGQSIAIQEVEGEDRVLVGGRIQTDNPDHANFLVYRVAPADFSYDATFGTVGRSTVNVGYFEGQNFDLELSVQPNGRILLASSAGFGATAGTGGINSAIVRLNRNGTIDPTFSDDGRASIAMSPDQFNDGFYGLALRPDGDIVAAGAYTNAVGTAPPYRAALAKYIGDHAGMAEMSCGPAGIASGFPYAQFSRKILTLPDNRFILVSSTGFNAARFLPNGQLDTSYDVDGLSTNFGQTVTDAVLQPDGKLVMVGYTGGVNGGRDNDFWIARINENGAPDQEFGGYAVPPTATTIPPGYVRISFSDSGDFAHGVLVQPDGSILVVGTAGESRRFALARLDAFGNLDPTFVDSDGINELNTPGLVVTATSGINSEARDVALQADGKFVVAGFADANYGRWVIARYYPNGGLDAGFGGNEAVRTGMVELQTNYRDLASSVKILANGKIVVGGLLGKRQSSAFGLLQLNADGRRDTGFGTAGLTKVPFGEFDASTSNLADIAIQADGKIVLGGMARFYTPAVETRAVLLRFRPNGQLDDDTQAGHFQGDGTVMRKISGPGLSDGLYSVAIRPDGVILAAVTQSTAPSAQRAVAMCLQP